MQSELTITLVPGELLAPATRAEVLRLCSAAYEEDFEPYLRYSGPVHVLGYRGAALVSHAMWVTRWLQAGDGPPLRTAYVEAVATEPGEQGRGYASALLRQLAAAIGDFDLGALSPSDAAFYRRLGWEAWRGPLAIRTDAGLLPTPEEEVMILRLPRTGPLDLGAPLSAEWREGELW
ncbi:MAG TPA: GNAT family N-acetyltransferase [Herpetosiphonaceae bacterium]